jgi:vitamin B12 transporter
MTRFKLFFLAGAALLPAMPAYAQDGAAPDDIDGMVDQIGGQRNPDTIVVTASGVPQIADQAGRAITVVSRDEIEKRQTVALSDLLATTPGVTVSRNGGPGAVTAVRLRGAEGDQTLVLIDGVRANDPSSPGGGFDFGNLLTGSIERVEVLRGPNSVVWGSQAIGGVVNVITQRPANGFAARANAEYGSADQVSANAALSGGNDIVQGTVTAGYLRTDGISQAASGTEADGYRQLNASGRVNLEFAPGFGAEARAYYADSRLDLDGFAPPTYSFGDTAEYSKTEEFYGYVGLHGDVGPVKNRLGFSLGDINRDNFDPSFGSAPSFFGRGRSERFEYQGDASVAERLRVVVGAEHEKARYYDGFDRFEAGVTSVYGEAIVTPVEQVTLTAGVRNDDHKAYGSHITWGANLAVRPAGGTTIQASYGEGFKSPTLYQLYSAFGTRSLEPETAKSYEVGVRQGLAGGKLMLGATWFRRDTVNQIDFISCSPAPLSHPAICNNRPFGTYDNIARTRASGIELEMVARPIDGLSLRGSYSHVEAENRSAGANLGKDLARRPQDAGSVSIDYKLPSGLNLGATVLVTGPSFDNAANSVKLDGYALVGLRAEMPVSGNLSVYARVENALDENYQTVSGYGTQGRTAYAGLRLKL